MPISIRTLDNEAVDATFMRFAGGERHVQLGNVPLTQELRLRAQLTSSDDILDLLLLRNALLAQCGSGQAIVIEIPYMPYARQDRVCAPGQAFSLQVMAQLLGCFPNQRIVTWDCHSAVGLELTGADSVTAATIVQRSHKLMAELADTQSVLIAPDKGARQRCAEIAAAVALTGNQSIPLVTCEKSRDPATGRIVDYHVPGADLTGKTAIIADDICDGGATFSMLAKALKQHGVTRIVLYVTHGIFSQGLGVFDGLIDHIYTTNSFPPPSDNNIAVDVITL